MIAISRFFSLPYYSRHFIFSPNIIVSLKYFSPLNYFISHVLITCSLQASFIISECKACFSKFQIFIRPLILVFASLFLYTTLRYFHYLFSPLHTTASAILGLSWYSHLKFIQDYDMLVISRLIYMLISQLMLDIFSSFVFFHRYFNLYTCHLKLSYIFIISGIS